MELMTGKLHLVAHLLEKMQNPAELDALPNLLSDSLVGHHGLSMLVLDPGNRTLFTTNDAQFPLAVLNRTSIRKIQYLKPGSKLHLQGFSHCVELRHCYPQEFLECHHCWSQLQWIFHIMIISWRPFEKHCGCLSVLLLRLSVFWDGPWSDTD
jgi:hypothetical protein